MKHLFWFCLLLLAFPKVTWAIYDPLSVPNNIYGIHVADPSDIKEVAPLVNSNNGDWGYVTIIIPETDRNTGKWQTIFDKMRRDHLIPLVRLATHVENASWVKPNTETIRDWISFLNSLNWPIKNRYVILFNEPNHTKEWGGTIDPEGFANIVINFGKELKTVSEDFFIIPGGLDVSAASDGLSLDAAEYLRRMVRANPQFLDVIDGWSSHSYPNPGFSGSPYASGRGSVRSYQWEMNLLQALGLKKKLPIFITETGWTHSHGKSYQGGYSSPEKVGDYMQTAAQTAWSDDKIVAVTPFVFNYQDYPFDHFSWKKLGRDEYYPHYYAYQSLTKKSGEPKQVERYELDKPLLPTTLVSGSTYILKGTIKNVGQGIVNSDDYQLMVGDGHQGFTSLSENLPTIEPGQTGEVTLHVKTPETTGKYAVVVFFQKHRETIIIETREVEVIPPPNLEIKAQLGWKKANEAKDVTVLIYGKDEALIHKYTGLTLTNGVVKVNRLTNVVPGHWYRVVTLIPSYLPRQQILNINQSATKITMKRFYPLDQNRDGTWNAWDFWVAFQMAPFEVLRLFF